MRLGAENVGSVGFEVRMPGLNLEPSSKLHKGRLFKGLYRELLQGLLRGIEGV